VVGRAKNGSKMAPAFGPVGLGPAFHLSTPGFRPQSAQTGSTNLEIYVLKNLVGSPFDLLCGLLIYGGRGWSEGVRRQSTTMYYESGRPAPPRWNVTVLPFVASRAAARRWSATTCTNKTVYE
jgi:hypothetical protein